MENLRIKPNQTVKLINWDPDEIDLFPKGKQAAEKETKKLNKKLESLQELLYAEHKHKILIILQAMDTGGKDGTIRAVFDGVNPAGVRVASFKIPTDIEREHDFLWRIHQQTPRNGEMVIFNRSHYEDVLVVRVHQLVEEEIWKKRYEHINNFEKLLADEGTTIIKFYLHISKQEQKERLQERLDIHEKNWKFSSGDLKERLLWDEYMSAYEAVLENTSTEYAPWYVIPANRNWYRNYLISSILVDKLEGLKMNYPQPEPNLDKIIIDG